MTEEVKKETKEEIKEEKNNIVTEFIGSESSNPLLSKSIWLGVATSVLPFFPKAMVWWTNHPQFASVIIGVLIVLIRLVTKKELDFINKQSF